MRHKTKGIEKERLCSPVRRIQGDRIGHNPFELEMTVRLQQKCVEARRFDCCQLCERLLDLHIRTRAQVRWWEQNAESHEEFVKWPSCRALVLAQSHERLPAITILFITLLTPFCPYYGI